MPTSVQKRVILLGKGELAIRIGNWFRESAEHAVAAVVPVIPEPTWTASLSDWATPLGLPTVASGRHRDLSDLAPPPYDLAFSVYYETLLDRAFLAGCRRAVNLHNAPLPRYRGVRPINWALKQGETEHGVTIHEMGHGIDDGPIISQLRFSIYPELEEVIDVYRRCLDAAWLLFLQTMPLFDKIEPRPQDEREATIYRSRQNALLGDRSDFTRETSATPARTRFGQAPERPRSSR